MLPKATPSATDSITSSPEIRDREHSRLSALSNFSIGDVFRDINLSSGPKSVKFPEKLIKVLEQNLQNIAMGKHPRCVLLLLYLYSICIT